jgi:DNA-binding SARP family transcriptional activator
MLRGHAGTPHHRARLSLCGCWDLRVDGDQVELGGREQRVLALLALQGRRPRSQIAGTLWPDTTDERALTSLRAAVLRVRRAAPGLVDARRTTLALAPDVAVDVADLLHCAALVERERTVDPHDCVAVLSRADLLPGWYEDWVLFERERLQQVRLDALEALARAELAAGDAALALTAAHEAIAIEPLLESAHAIAIRAHLQAGNRSAALREYRAYRHRLRQVLAIEPSKELGELVARPLIPRQGPATIDLEVGLRRGAHAGS